MSYNQPMRWVLWVAVVVSAASVRAEEAPVHRPSPIAFRASVLAGAGFTFGPDPVCPSCENPLASFSGGVELAVVLRSSAGEGFLRESSQVAGVPAGVGAQVQTRVRESFPR